MGLGQTGDSSRRELREGGGVWRGRGSYAREHPCHRPPRGALPRLPRLVAARRDEAEGS